MCYDPSGSVVLRCIHQAQMGMVVFAYDMIGYNDSCQLEHRKTPMDQLYSMSPMAMQTWNSIRAIDFLETLEDVDVKRIGVTGASGGGTQSFVISAVDDRIAAAAPICMPSLKMQGGCICENGPSVRINGTSVDITALHAPKPLFIGSCTGDWTKDSPEMEYPFLDKIYGLYSRSENFSNHHIDFGHNYNPELCHKVYHFFNDVFFDGALEIPAYAEGLRPGYRNLMVWWGKQLPQTIAYADLQKLWRDHLATADHSDDVNLLPSLLNLMPTTIDDAAKSDPETLSVIIEGNKVTFSALTPESEKEKLAIDYWDCYNRSLFSNRVIEMLGVLKSNPVLNEIAGIEGAGPAALFAAAISDQVNAVSAEMNNMDYENEDHWREHMYTPSILAIGGMKTIEKALAGKRVDLR